MENFIAIIKVAGIEPDKMASLREKEAIVMQQYADAGNLTGSYVRKDLSGAFLFFKANDAAHAHNLVAGLPMYPYMNVEIVELLNEEM